SLGKEQRCLATLWSNDDPTFFARQLCVLYALEAKLTDIESNRLVVVPHQQRHEGHSLAWSFLVPGHRGSISLRDVACCMKSRRSSGILFVGCNGGSSDLRSR